MKKFVTREVFVGSVGIGKNNLIRIQSMTSCSVKDHASTIDQIKQLQDSGCEIVRFAIVDNRDIQHCEIIKTKLIQQNITIPLVADVHFFPRAAYGVVDYVEKVRINPGNFVSFSLKEKEEKIVKEKIYNALIVLIEKCKKYKRSLRIGVNHGSLSPLMLEKWGNTSKGMVESALQYGEILRECDFHEFLFSMKASNPVLMIQAYEELVQEMLKRGWDYPLHLGVTEAGSDAEGRIKSAFGIGTLLAKGIGDTIRVSLTEDPSREIPPAKALVSWAKKNRLSLSFSDKQAQFFSKRPIEILMQVKEEEIVSDTFFHMIGYSESQDGLTKDISSVDALFIDSKKPLKTKTLSLLKQLQKAGLCIYSFLPIDGAIRVYDIDALDQEMPTEPFAIVLQKIEEKRDFSNLFKKADRIIFAPINHNLQDLFAFLEKYHFLLEKMIVFLSYDITEMDVLPIHVSAELGALFLNFPLIGIGIHAPIFIEDRRKICLNVLQTLGYRITKTEFISCPTCGRTEFPLMEIVNEAKRSLSHFPGKKIAIMGCIVNGLGEMQDADFAIVGIGNGRVNIYKNKQCINKSIDSSQSIEYLKELLSMQEPI